MLELRGDFSRRILLQLIIAAGAVVVLGLVNSRFVVNFYFHNQSTQAGIVINSGVLLLFVLGLIRIAWNLLRLSREERMLVKFVDQYEKGSPKPNSNTLIGQRYETIQWLSRRQAPIDQSALAASLVAAESTRNSLPKFVNGILILLGVFGTLVALSIALIGASGLLESGQEMANLNLIIHGMATASSTTITAIMCFVFMGYFYLRMSDAQTRLIGNIEQVTTVLLMPRQARDAQGMIEAVGILVSDLRQMVHVMERVQTGQAQAAQALGESVENADLRLKQLGHDVGLIRNTLREGFRLPVEGKR
jgi:hypothetical protein